MATKRNNQSGPKRPKASTADVLGPSPRQGKVPAKWKMHFGHLQQMRGLLLTRKDELVRDAQEEQPSYSLHMADAGTGSFDRDLALSRLSSEQDALYEIDEAINRIYDGSYGICELTGKSIEAGRLEAIPWTRFSLEAEETLERKGAVRRAQLAPREPVSRETSESEEAGMVEESSTREE